jgi:phospho-N-acetylmuramoyl-pentapeptide-transferase
VIALLIAGGASFVLALATTRVLIRLLLARQVSQPILANDARKPQHRAPQHQHKAGTPTMGGFAIVVAAFCGWGIAHLRRGVIFTNTGLLTMATIVGAGAVGFIDDMLKIRNRRNLGLNKGTKSLGLLAVAVAFVVLMQQQDWVPTTIGLITRVDQPGVDVGAIGWSVWGVAVIYATSNAFNVTDGLDGLAAGSAIFVFFALTVICFWQFRNASIYGNPHALDIAVVAIAMVGGCAGFLWYNAAPAKIFMGDVGSLAIGTAMACLTLATGTHFLLPLLAGLYVAEAGSVVLQVISFRGFGGRRIFRMSPIHHHFELVGWPETTIIIRFWIVAGLCGATGLGLFYADFVRTGAAG